MHYPPPAKTSRPSLTSQFLRARQSDVIWLTSCRLGSGTVRADSSKKPVTVRIHTYAKVKPILFGMLDDDESAWLCSGSLQARLGRGAFCLLWSHERFCRGVFCLLWSHKRFCGVFCLLLSHNRFCGVFSFSRVAEGYKATRLQATNARRTPVKRKK